LRLFQVAIRVRPVLPSEVRTGAQTVVSVEGNSLVLVDPSAYSAAAAVARDSGQFLDVGAWARHFTFDHCFWSANSDDANFCGQHEVGVAPAAIYCFFGCADSMAAVHQCALAYVCTRSLAAPPSPHAQAAVIS
jgi:hypothetical protein